MLWGNNCAGWPWQPCVSRPLHCVVGWLPAARTGWTFCGHLPKGDILTSAFQRFELEGLAPEYLERVFDFSPPSDLKKSELNWLAPRAIFLVTFLHMAQGNMGWKGSGALLISFREKLSHVTLMSALFYRMGNGAERHQAQNHTSLFGGRTEVYQIFKKLIIWIEHIRTRHYANKHFKRMITFTSHNNLLNGTIIGPHFAAREIEAEGS